MPNTNKLPLVPKRGPCQGNDENKVLPGGRGCWQLFQVLLGGRGCWQLFQGGIHIFGDGSQRITVILMIGLCCLLRIRRKGWLSCFNSKNREYEAHWNNNQYELNGWLWLPAGCAQAIFIQPWKWQAKKYAIRAGKRDANIEHIYVYRAPFDYFKRYENVLQY